MHAKCSQCNAVMQRAWTSTTSSWIKYYRNVAVCVYPSYRHVVWSCVLDTWFEILKSHRYSWNLHSSFKNTGKFVIWGFADADIRCAYASIHTVDLTTARAIFFVSCICYCFTREGSRTVNTMLWCITRTFKYWPSSQTQKNPTELLFMYLKICPWLKP